MDARTLNPPITTELLLGSLSLAVAAVVFFPDWPLAVLLCSLCLIGGIFRWNWLFYALLFCLPLAPLLKSDLPFEDIATVVRMVAALGVFAGLIVRRESLPWKALGSPLSLAAIGYLLVVAVSAAKNGISPTAPRSLFHLLSYVVFYFGLVGWLRTTEQLQTAVHTLVLTSIVVSLFGIYQFAIGSYGDFYFQLYPDQVTNLNAWDGRVTSLLNYSNCLGGFMSLLLAFSLATAVMDATAKWRKIGVFAFVLGTITILLSQSRGALAGFLAIVIVGVASLARRRMVRVALLVGAIIMLIIVVPMLADFSSHLAVSSDDISLLGRLVAFASAAQVFLQSPVIGIGYGNFRNLMDFDVFDLQANSWDAHNLYLQLLAETGVIGFLTFAMLFSFALLSARRMRREENDLKRLVGFAALAALCSVAAHGLVDYLFNASSQFGTLFWTILAMLAAFQGTSSFKSAFSRTRTPL